MLHSPVRSFRFKDKKTIFEAEVVQLCGKQMTFVSMVILFPV